MNNYEQATQIHLEPGFLIFLKKLCVEKFKITTRIKLR